MADCICALAHGHARLRASSAPSSSFFAAAAPEPQTAPAAPLTNAALRDQCELATAPLTAVHDFLHLLCDCSTANTGQPSGMRMDCLCALLHDLAEQLAQAEALIDQMAAIGRDAFPDTDVCDRVEDQGYQVFVLRSRLCVLEDAIGASHVPQHHIAGDSFTGTVDRLAERLLAVKTALNAIAFPPCAPTP